jgi:hypothetical protein
MNKITTVFYDVLDDKTLVVFFREDDDDIPRCYYATNASAYRLIRLMSDKQIKVRPSRYGWYIFLRPTREV